jgi:RNA polymerase sigma factor for flagellar operon FliA
VLRDDLLAAGVFGLLDSLRKNGETRGAAFEWYARMRIRGAIFDELRAQDWLTRRARAAASAGGTEGRPVTVAALISLQEVSALDEALHLVAINEDPAAQIEALHDGRALAEAMAKLPERERCILGMHYFDGVKFKDIGVKLGVSEPRISQLHARALGRLRVLLDHAA